MAREFRTDLELKLKNPDFARAFGAAQAKSQAALALAKARRNVGISQKMLAEKSGHSQPYIAKLERGDANPTLVTVGVLLALMGQRLTADVAPLASPICVMGRPSVDIQRIGLDFVPEESISQKPTASTSYHEIKNRTEVLNWPSAASTTH